MIDEDWIAPPPDFPIDRVLTALAAQAGRPARVVHPAHDGHLYGGPSDPADRVGQ